MTEQKSSMREFWIGFSDTEYFMKYLFKEGFGHVYIITKDEWNWMILDPRNGYLDMSIIPIKVSEDLPQKIMEHNKHHLIRVKTQLPLKKWPNLNIFRSISCMNIIKYVLGVKLFTWSPYHLHCRLKKMSERGIPKNPLKEVEILNKVI